MSIGTGPARHRPARLLSEVAGQSPALAGPSGLTLALTLTGDQVEAIARRVAAMVAIEQPASDLLTVDEAAAFLRCKPQRIRDLLSQRRLTRVKDGGRTLVERADLEAHLEREP